MRTVGKRYEDVIDAFVAGESEPHRNSHGNVFFEGDVLYSYGRHFPLAVRKVRGTPRIVVNGDKCSLTTGGHQRMVLDSALGNCVTISLSAFLGARLFKSLLSDGVLPYCVDTKLDLHGQPEKTTLLKDFDTKLIPVGATLHTWKNPDTKQVEVLGWHRAGMSLWDDDGKYYLAGMDEQQYFVSLLPGQPRTCVDALEQLKPESVQRAEKRGLTVKRQGDWFFIDITACVPQKEIKAFWRTQKAGELKSAYDRPNAHAHKVDRLALGADVSIPQVVSTGRKELNRIFRRDSLVVSGRVTHTEHGMVKLGTRKEGKLWIAVQNTAKGNWSARGRVD